MSLILYYLVSVFFFKKKEEKVFLCVLIVFFFFFFFLNGSVESGGMVLDDLSFSMVFLTLVLMMMVFMVAGDSEKKHFFLCLGMVVVVLFFLVDNVFFFFILFEFSLLPIYFLISFWGVQPERLVAIKYMMIYTLVASSPLFFFVSMCVETGFNSLSLICFEEVDSFLVFVSFLAFWVKIPSFMFHSWLPKAHVEAPLEGSMILAGVMLKVGMYGMVRFCSIFSPMNMKEVGCFFFVLGLLGSVISLVVAISSDDMKMSVAFSSISHMNLCMANLAGMKVACIEGWIMIMVSHGLCSPMMFFLVTKIYECTGSRSMLVSKGFVSKFPFFQFLCFLVWSMNISVPPSLSFLGEVSMIFSIYSMYVYSIFFVFLYFVISSFFSMFNYGVQGHSCFKIVWKGNVNLVLFSNLVVFSGILIFFFFFFFDFFY